MKVKAFLQECLVYIDINEDIYTTNKLKIGFVLSYMNEKEARDWRKLYLKNLEDPVTGRLSGDTQFHMTIGRISKHFNPHTHAVMMPSSQVTIGRTSKSLNPRLFAVTMVLSQVTIGRTSKPFDPRVPIFPLIIIQPLLVG